MTPTGCPDFTVELPHGHGARNLVVRDCLFEDCAAIDKAAPQISAECVTPAGWDVGRVAPGFVGGDVLLEGNRFVRPSGPIYDFKCGANVVILGGDREPLP